MPVVPAAGYPTGPEAPQPVPLSPPEDYQGIKPTPEAFGAQVGQSMSALGRVLTTSADEFAQVARERQDLHNNVVTDNQINNWTDAAEKKFTGDPNAPPGSPEAIGLMGLRGEAAIKAFPKFYDDIKTSREQMRGQLENPMQQLEFDKQTRRQLQYLMTRAGTHYDQQYDVFQTKTNEAGLEVTRRKMDQAALAGDDAAFTEQVRSAMDWGMKDLQQKGLDKNPEEVWAMQGRVRVDAVERRLNGYRANGDTDGILHILSQESGPDGAISAEKAAEYRKIVDAIEADKAARRALQPGGGGGGGGGGTAPRDTGQSGTEAELHNWGGIRRPGVPAAGPQAGGFQSFESDEDGVRAVAWQLDRYASGATTGTPLRTIRQMVSTWAPPGENDTPTLIANAAKIVGVDPDTPLDLNNPDIKAKMVEATIRNEQGGRLPIDQDLIRRAVASPPAVGGAGVAGVIANPPAGGPDSIERALKLVGQRENSADLAEYLHNGGVNMSPKDAAWCAGFVNATLAQQGIQGTHSLVATSFLNWGNPVANTQDVKRDDVAVVSGGLPAGEVGGHVGFATGNKRVDPVTGKPQIEMLSGNERVDPNDPAAGHLVATRWRDADTVTLRRAPGTATAFQQGAEAATKTASAAREAHASSASSAAKPQTAPEGAIIQSPGKPPLQNVGGKWVPYLPAGV